MNNTVSSNYKQHEVFNEHPTMFKHECNEIAKKHSL